MNKQILLIVAAFALTLSMAFADTSFISNTGGAQIVTRDGNVSIGTLQSLGKLHVNGSIYQNAVYQPKIVGYLNDSNKLNGSIYVYVRGKYAYVTAVDNDSLSIIDVSNPPSPSFVGYITDRRLDGAFDIHVSGKYAYVTSQTNDSLSIIDVSNASLPIIVGHITSSSIDNINGLYVSGKYAYVASWFLANSLSILDISNPTLPTIVSSVTSTVLSGANSVFVQGKYAYVASDTNNSLSIIDVSNVTSPAIVGFVNDDKRLNRSSGVHVSGRYAYVSAFRNDSLSVIDVSNVTSPVIVGFVSDPRMGKARDVFVAGKYAYVTGQDSDSLSIIDISNPSSPSIVGYLTDNARLDGAQGVFVSGKYAYVASRVNNSDSLSIIDISGIDSPAASIGAVEAGSLSVTENAQVANDLYVGNGLNVGPGGMLVDGKVSIFHPFPDNTSNSTLLWVGNSTTLLVAKFGDGAGKIDVGTIDPVYTIGGRQYATYMAGMTGVKEETTGQIEMDCRGDLCSYEIDFTNLPEGSDLWLFAKTTDLKKSMGKMTVLLTPSFRARVWYEKDEESYKLKLFARRITGASKEVSYRLTAPRFDHERWGNYHEGGSGGFVIP